MRRYQLSIYGLAFGLLAATAVSLFSAFETRRTYEARASLICGAVAARVQVGAFRDAFDQAYSLAQFSASGRSVPVSMRDGAALYGQAPADLSAFHREECKAEGRPDFLLTLFFDNPPVFGLWWLAYAAFFSFLFFLSVLAFKIFSYRVVDSALTALSKGIWQFFEGKKSVGLVNSLALGLAEKTPAIRELKQEISHKLEITKQNSDFREKLSALTKATQEGENERRKVSEIVRQVLHDIRTPVAYLRTMLIVEDNGSDLKQGGFASIKKIEKLMDDLSQIEGAGIVEERNREMALIECVMHEVVSAKRFSWPVSVTLDFSFDPKILSLASVEAARLGRILDNILQNSFEATNGDGIIRAEVRVVDKAVKISISDTGCGMPKEVLELLGSTQVTFGKANGNGIGLFRAKQWIDAWGGSLLVESAEGKGTTVTITLPRKETAAKFTADLSWLEQKEVVVLDDNALAARSLLKKLDGRGQHFSKMEDYADWLYGSDSMGANAISVYDLRLNPGSGLDLLRINPQPKNALLYTDDYLDAEAMALSAELGFCIYPKPFLTF